MPGLPTTYTIVVTNTRPQSGDRRECHRRVSGRARCADMDLRRRRRLELRRRVGHRQSRNHCHARGRRPRHVHRDWPDRGERHRPARQHGDGCGAGRRRRSGSDQQHGDQFGVAGALRRPADHQGGSGQRGGRHQYRLHDHGDECGPSDAPGVTVADPTPPA